MKNSNVINKEDYKNYVSKFLINFFKNEYNEELKLLYAEDIVIVEFKDNYFDIELFTDYIYDCDISDSIINNKEININNRLTAVCRKIFKEYENLFEMGGI